MAAATKIESLPLIHQGKVRDTYRTKAGDRLIVTTDRISAFDVVLDDIIPNKGVILNRMTEMWFGKTKHIVPNHLTGIDPTTVVTEEEAHLVRGRSVVAKDLKPILCEAVVRGYLVGTGWKDYQKTGSVCGIVLRSGLRRGQKLSFPLFTPSTKAPPGQHDQNVSLVQIGEIIGERYAFQICELSRELYNFASAYALSKGLIIADTKFEFGFDEKGDLTLMDEVLTPDSSRYWPIDGYEAAFKEGRDPPSYDKQFVRNWLEEVRIADQPWDKKAPAPRLPQDIIEQTAAKYQQALHTLCIGAK